MVAGPAGVERRLDGRRRCRRCGCGSSTGRRRHHHDGVADAGPHLLERRDGVVGGLEEVHDLVAQVGQALASASARRRGRAPCAGASGLTGPNGSSGSSGARASAGRRPRSAGRRAAAGSRCRRRRPRRPAPAPGSSSGVRARASAAAARDASTTSTRVPARRRPRVGPLGRAPGHGQDGALDRAHAPPRGPARRRWSAPRPARPARAGRRGRSAPSVRPRSSWRQDDPGVAPGPHERAVGDGLAGGVEVGRRPAASSSSATDSRVRAMLVPGVAVGHRVDVEPVDELLVGPEPVPERR